MARTVADIMERDAPSVSPETGVEEVVRLFREHDVPALPVVNDGGRCVGIVTEKDLVIADDAGDLHIPHYIELFGGLVFLPELHHLNPVRRFDEHLRKAAAATVEDLMTPDPDTIAPEATLHEAARIIARHDHSRLPVVEHGRFLGLITRADVLAALSAEE